MLTSFLSNLAIHRKEVIYYISPRAGTAEPLRVSPPKAVDYVIDLKTLITATEAIGRLKEGNQRFAEGVRSIDTNVKQIHRAKFID